MSEDWQPGASLELLKKRARMLADIRAFFAAREVLEVETPILSAASTTDPQIESFVSHYNGPLPAGGHDGRGGGCYLHTSPEFPMKRLLAAGAGSIYQICKVFRNGEAGRLHNPEFTMLEWYRPGFDHYQLMQEVEELVCALLPEAQRPTTGAERITYAEAFQQYTGVDPHRVTAAELQRWYSERAEAPVGMSGSDRDAWLDLVLTQWVEPGLATRGMVFMVDYPAAQASLARVHTNAEGVEVAQRFELYLNGVELANGFHELQDAAQQAVRFQQEQSLRKARGLPYVAEDKRLLAALRQGLPACAGVALGLDRLLMQVTGSTQISQVLAFDFGRA